MRHLPWLAATVMCIAAAVPPAPAQDATPAAKSSPDKVATDDLQKQTDAFVKGVQESKAFDDAAKAFVTKVALRKLRQVPDQRRLVGAEKLDASLDRVREALSGPKGLDGAACQQIREAAATWLVEQARAADVTVAANAALLLGDLRAEGKPWIEGGKQLARLAATADLKPVVRAAAVAGLARQADELTAKPPAPPEFVAAVTPALMAIVTAPTPGSDPAARWLVSRALDVVAKVVPAASPELAQALLAIMADPARSTDERVRAAIALGRTATTESSLDAARAVTATRRLAEDALGDSLANAKDRALAASLSNMPLAIQQQPGFPEAGSSSPSYPLDALEVERDAWRLLKLSEAIARPKVKKGAAEAAWGEPLDGGLALLLEDNSEVVALARQLRTEAEALVENPTSARVAEARETIVTWSAAGP